MTPLTQKIHALLFTAGETVSVADLSSLTKEPEQDVRKSLQELSEGLAQTGLAIVMTESHAQIVTSSIVAEFLAQFETQETDELSRAAMETLSIIAYRGPIARFDIDTIRGIDSRRMLRQLLRRGMVRQIRVSGKIPMYDITEEFLSHIGVPKREALPNFEKLSTSEDILRILKPQS